MAQHHRTGRLASKNWASAGMSTTRSSRPWFHGWLRHRWSRTSTVSCCDKWEDRVLPNGTKIKMLIKQNLHKFRICNSVTAKECLLWGVVFVVVEEEDGRQWPSAMWLPLMNAPVTTSTVSEESQITTDTQSQFVQKHWNKIIFF